jgi:hypothetical protein
MKAIICMLLLTLLALTASAADISGKWSGTFAPEGGDSNPAFAVLKQSGTTLTGTAGPDESQQWPIQNGKIEGNKITLEVKADDGTVYKCDLTVTGDNMKGDIAASRPDGNTLKAKMELARVK